MTEAQDSTERNNGYRRLAAANQEWRPEGTPTTDEPLREQIASTTVPLQHDGKVHAYIAEVVDTVTQKL